MKALETALLERNRYRAQIIALRETAEIYRLTISELKKRCTHLDDERIRHGLQFQDVEFFHFFLALDGKGNFYNIQHFHQN